ncbi:MAG: hypothetical protein C0457_16155 [Polymorphum sp.]|nr:hypothetical protein [Polymorphum sp.]
MLRNCIATLCFALLLLPAAEAATVRTETILVTPPEQNASGNPAIPPEDLLPPIPDEAGADDAGGLMDEADPAEGIESTEEGQSSEVSPQNLLPVPEVHYGPEGLPAPVARMRDQLMEAARSGDVERMRMVLEGNEMMPTLSLAEIGDPIEFLKHSSGDGQGQEILAILLDVMEAGWVHVDAGTPQEMYIWPYFARYPFDKLTPEQKVEMYRIVTAADFAEMDAYGAWLFYRVGIGPDGTLHYFVAGE